MPKSISFHRLPGLNSLFVDYVENFERVSSFYEQDYRQPVEQWKGIRETTNLHKKDLVEGLLEDAQRWESGRQTIKNIEALAKPETLAVVTGQQVGLFGGPLFTFYKATSAVLWARRIEKETGRPTVPVFWMETTDHDFYEINYIRMLNLAGEEVTLSLSNAPKEKRRVVGGITFNGEIKQLIHRLWNLMPANTYRGPLLEMLSDIYKPGETVGNAFARLFTYLFGDDGLVLFDADNARAKGAVRPLLDRIIESGDGLNDLLEESTKAVEDKGYQAQISPQEDRLQLFVKEGEVRIPVSNDGTLLYEDRPHEQIGLEGLRRRAAENPEIFLPKVSLRPIMQDYLFPTAAYLAGPSEIAYFAQLKPLYQHLGVRMPAIIPRLSLTLLEAKIKKILDKYGFTPEQLSKGPQELIRERLESDSSNDIVGLFAGIRKKWGEIHEELGFGLMHIDPTLQHPMEKTLARFQQGLNVLEDKARMALSHKNETLVSQVEKCCRHLAPHSQLQERRYSMQYYLVRYGRSLGQRIRSQAKIDLFRHQLIDLENGD